MQKTQANVFIKERSMKLKNGQYMLTEPIYGYKKVYGNRSSSCWGIREELIATLIIPAGAVVNLGDELNDKMRTTQAYCFDIVEKDNPKNEVSEAYSTHDSAFKYYSGKKLGLRITDSHSLVVNAENYVTDFHVNGRRNDRATAVRNALKKVKCTPSNFSNSLYTCAGGIHFFVDIESAKNY